MSIESDLNELAAVVADPSFKQKQLDFFTKYCTEFSPEEENRLAYTTIHKEYETQVEQEISERLGAEKIRRLTEGLEAFLAQERTTRTQEVAEAIDVLSSLADFQSFKAAMLARKVELASGGGPGGGLREVKGILHLDDLVERMRDLRQTADTAAGWQEVANTSDITAFVKQCEGSKSVYCRMTLGLPLSPAACCDMFVNMTPDSLQWRSNVSGLSILKDFGPRDQVAEMTLAVPWAMRYLFSMPDKAVVRCLSKENWPEQGDYAYVAAPFDPERNVTLEEFGVMGIKTGVISPDPADPDKCIITTMDVAQLGIMPTWGLGFLIRKMVAGQLLGMVTAYKKTSNYQQFQAASST